MQIIKCDYCGREISPNPESNPWLTKMEASLHDNKGPNNSMRITQFQFRLEIINPPNDDVCGVCYTDAMMHTIKELVHKNEVATSPTNIKVYGQY